jgi:hypothetical protein
MEITTSSRVPDVLSRRLLSSQLLCVGSTELAAPSPDRFVGDNDAALQKHFLDQPQAQRKPEIQPDRMAMICGGKRWFL